MKKTLFFCLAACTAIAGWAEDKVTATYNEKMVSVALDNSESYIAFQMDIKMQGASATENPKFNGERLSQEGTAIINGAQTAAPFVLDSHVLGDGTLRVIAYNLANRPISSEKGALFTIDLSALPSTMTFSNVFFVKADDLTEVTLATETVKGNPTAIENVVAPNGNGTVYDLQGRKIQRGQNGLIIVDGKKQIVK